MTDQPQVPSSAPVAPAPAGSPSSSKSKPHVLGIVALITAIVGFIFACIPGALIVGWILLPIAFVLSLVAFFLKGSKWPAIVGLVLAIVGTIVGFVVFFAVMSNAVDEAFEGPGTSVAQPSEASDEPKAAEQDPAAAAGDIEVTIDGATQTVDYEGKDALVVSFTFTNNSAKDSSFMIATSAKAFQNGIELESAILMDDTYDSSNSMKDVKPGNSLVVQWAYVLTDKSDVTVEVQPLFSFDDEVLATQTFTVS